MPPTSSKILPAQMCSGGRSPKTEVGFDPDQSFDPNLLSSRSVSLLGCTNIRQLPKTNKIETKLPCS